MSSSQTAGLRGKTALVTGASRGIGLAIARALRDAGVWVGMAARSEADLLGAAREVGGHAFPADVSSAEQVAALAAWLRDTLGDAPDFIVNSAGSFALVPVHETSIEQFDQQIAANLRAPFLVVRAFLPRMVERGSGHVVSVGSVAGRTALPGNGAYGASKFGLRGFHEVLAQEMRGSGVRCTLLEPSATDTPLWDPLDPDHRADLPTRASMLRPEDVARAAVFALDQPTGVEISHLAIRATR